MNKIISVQDIRQSLSSITDQAMAGTTFVVIRNSKPVFRIVPPFETSEPAGTRALSLSEITGKLDGARGLYDLSSQDLNMIIHEAHAEYGGK